MHKLTTIIAVTVIAIALLGTIAIATMTNANASTSVSRSELELGIAERKAGTANTKNSVIVDTLNKDTVSVLVQDNGGNFANERFTTRAAVAADGNYTLIGNQTLGTSNIKGFGFGIGVNTTMIGGTYDPTVFRFLNFSVPALGSGETSVITYSVK
jgi:hypothetical protein